MATVGDDLPALCVAAGEAAAVAGACPPACPDTFTAQAFITTDLDDNQITAFHPGAMNFSHQNHVGDATNVGLGIVAPDGREGMLQHAREFHEAGIPFVFDPGQGLPMFDGEELLTSSNWRTTSPLNDYEAQLLQERTGQKHRGAGQAGQGAGGHAGRAGLDDLRRAASRSRFPALKHTEVVDPDRLRRRLPRRPAVRHRAAAATGRPPGGWPR